MPNNASISSKPNYRGFSMTDKRVTFILDSKLQQKIIERQTDIMSKTQGGCSFSRALNIILAEALGVKL